MSAGWRDILRRSLGWLNAGVIPPVTPVHERTVYSVEEKTHVARVEQRSKLAIIEPRQRYARAER